MVALVLLAVLVGFAAIVVAKSVALVPQAEAAVIERLGRYSRTISGQLTLLVPFIDRVRARVDLRERVAYAPVSGRHKVYILDEAHMLSPQAWNAFLKTLEEPPPRTIFVLAVLVAAASVSPASSGVGEHHFLYVSEPGVRNYCEYGGVGVIGEHPDVQRVVGSLTDPTDPRAKSDDPAPVSRSPELRPQPREGQA